MNEKIDNFIERDFEKLIDLVTKIGEVPTPTKDEVRRAQAVRENLERWRLSGINFDQVGNLWVGWPQMKELAQDDRPLVLVTSHLDTVFPWDIEWKIERHDKILRGPGVADNATGVAALVWLAKYLKYHIPEPKNQYLLVFTVGQVENLKGIRCVIDRLWKTGLDPSRFLHVAIEGNGLGSITCGAVGARRYRISVRTLGGHSWWDAGVPNAINEASQIITQFYQKFSEKPGRTTFNVGTIEGGTAVSAIANEATFTTEFRSINNLDIRRLERNALKIVNRVTKNPAITVETQLIGERPLSPIHDEFPVIRIVKRILKDLELNAETKAGSTDANYPLSLGLQSIVLGCTSAFQTRTTNEWMQIPPLQQGLAQLCMLVDAIEEDFPSPKQGK